MNKRTNSKENEVYEKETELIKEYAKVKQSQNKELEFESFEGYELPPRTQFSMLKKPAVSIKQGKMNFNTAAIRLFEGMVHILPMVNSGKKRLAVVPLAEEESGSVEWSRYKEGKGYLGKTITSLDFVEKIFSLMAWNRNCRYKILGRITNSDRGLILVFDLEEAIMFTPEKKEVVDPKTGEIKRIQPKYYPDFYKDRIGKSYNDYMEGAQMNLFEDIIGYQSDVNKIDVTSELNKG